MNPHGVTAAFTGPSKCRVWPSGVQLRMKVGENSAGKQHKFSCFKGFAMICRWEISLICFELPVAPFRDISCWVWLLHAPGCG